MHGNRDEGFWNRPLQIVEGKNPREFQAQMHKRLSEARNWVEVENLHLHNAETIKQLDRATRVDVTAAIASRLAELKRNG